MRGQARRLSEAEHRRISAAIAAAEGRTSGEIVCVVAGASDGYFFASGLFALAFVLGAGILVALGLERLWIGLRLPVFATAQALAAGSALALLSWSPRLRLALTPRGVRFRAAHANAVRQFLARNVHRTEARTGVLVFVSLAERYAEVLADGGIDAQVPQERWDAIVGGLTESARDGRLAEGLVLAVQEAGRLLAAHFPPRAGDENELSDHLVEI